jgi:hypothetical protein
MKIYFSRLLSILSAFIVLASLASSGAAQQPTDRQQPTTQQQERQIPELATQEMSAEERRIRVPRECQGIKPVVETHSSNPVTLSTALTNYLTSHSLPSKGYGDPRVNRFFADSFRLKSCRVCYATLELRVKHGGDIWQNDGVTGGVAPFSPVKMFSSAVWPNSGGTLGPLPPIASSIPLLNQYIFTVWPPLPSMDVVVQDDTQVDAVTLTVWYY